jgi:hypothetical protein
LQYRVGSWKATVAESMVTAVEEATPPKRGEMRTRSSVLVPTTVRPPGSAAPAVPLASTRRTS